MKIEIGISLQGVNRFINGLSERFQGVCQYLKESKILPNEAYQGRELITCSQFQACKSCARRPLGKYVIFGIFRDFFLHQNKPKNIQNGPEMTQLQLILMNFIKSATSQSYLVQKSCSQAHVMVMGIGHMSILAAAWSHGLAGSSIMLELQEINFVSFHSQLLHYSVCFTFTM